jgi:dUTPase
MYCNNCCDDVPVFKFAVVDGLDPAVFMPTKQHDTDTGWDVSAAADISFKIFDRILIPLGIRMFAPSGWWMELRPRSSSFAKKYLHTLYGVVDETYENQLFFACQYIPPNDIRTSCCDTLKISKGERIGQLIPYRREIIKVENISNEDFDKLCKDRGGKRGTGGFGSTG